MRNRSLRDASQSGLVFIHGKGGVGKTAVSRAWARAWAEVSPGPVLWATFDDPELPPSTPIPDADIRSLFHLNIQADDAFEEYMGIQFRSSRIARAFSHNKIIRYLSRAAPGIPELVLLGKVWFERNHYPRLIIDLPSTGYGLTMFQSAKNFVKLFGDSPLSKDAQAMLQTFSSPSECAHVVVALPEETPLREGLELAEKLEHILPGNPASFVINRAFPQPSGNTRTSVAQMTDTEFETLPPLSETVSEYVERRIRLEKKNLLLWSENAIQPATLHFHPDESLALEKMLGAELRGYWGASK